MSPSLQNSVLRTSFNRHEKEITSCFLTSASLSSWPAQQKHRHRDVTRPALARHFPQSAGRQVQAHRVALIIETLALSTPKIRQRGFLCGRDAINPSSPAVDFVFPSSHLAIVQSLVFASYHSLPQAKIPKQ